MVLLVGEIRDKIGQDVRKRDIKQYGVLRNKHLQARAWSAVKKNKLKSNSNRTICYSENMKYWDIEVCSNMFVEKQTMWN